LAAKLAFARDAELIHLFPAPRFVHSSCIMRPKRGDPTGPMLLLGVLSLLAQSVASDGAIAATRSASIPITVLMKFPVAHHGCMVTLLRDGKRTNDLAWAGGLSLGLRGGMEVMGEEFMMGGDGEEDSGHYEGEVAEPSEEPEDGANTPPQVVDVEEQMQAAKRGTPEPDDEVRCKSIISRGTPH